MIVINNILLIRCKVGNEEMPCDMCKKSLRELKC